MKGSFLCHDVAGFQTDANDLNACVVKNLVHGFCAFDSVCFCKWCVAAGLISLIKRGISKDNRRVQASNFGSDLNSFLCRKDAFLQAVTGQTDHQLNAERKAVVLDERRALIDDIGMMSAAGKAQNFLVKGLHAELNDINAVALEVVENLRVDVVGTCGKMNLADTTGFLIAFRDL